MEKKKKISFGEKIALLTWGEGNKNDFGAEDDDEETGAKVVDYEEDEDEAQVKESRSTLRTKNVKLLEELDGRYAGVKMSRKKLSKTFELKGSNDKQSPSKLSRKKVDSSDDSEEEDDDIEEIKTDDESNLSNLSLNSGDTEDNVDVNEEEGLSEVDEDEESGGDISDDVSEKSEEVSDTEEKDDNAEDVQTLSATNKEDEIVKAQATQHQLRIWDALLEVRIRMQKMIIEANKLPQNEELQKVIDFSEKEDSKLPVTLDTARETVTDLLDKLIELQDTLIKQNPETSKGLSRKRKAPRNEDENDDEEIPSDEEITSSEDEDEKIEKEDALDVEIKSDPDDSEQESISSDSISKNKGKPKQKKRKVEEYGSAVQKVFDEFIPYRNEIIQKWNDKTQLSFGKYGKKNSAHEISTLKQIEHLLSNKERLVKRTQVKRSSYKTIRKPNSEALLNQVDEEIFDDDDFYHQLLRELIDRKTSNVSDPVQLSRHWLELQKLRSKYKRKVDTKASKGRKIRYDVHQKLVNFMAPDDSCTMSESAVKELMTSLFGKLK